jgi:hypothetical protein
MPLCLALPVWSDTRPKAVRLKSKTPLEERGLLWASVGGLPQQWVNSATPLIWRHQFALDRTSRSTPLSPGRDRTPASLARRAGSRRPHAAGCWPEVRHHGCLNSIEPKRNNLENDRTTAHEGGLGQRHETIPQGEPARLGSSPADRAFTRGVRAGIRRSARVKSACTRPIRSASTRQLGGVIIALHPAQRWISGGDRSWACAARSQSAAFSRIE